MTAEQRAAAAAKGAATLRAHKEAERERMRQREAERENTVRILREIRDSAEATPADRLRAIEMLSGLLPRY